MTITQEERAKYAEILEAYDTFQYLNNREMAAEYLTCYLCLGEVFESAYLAVSSYDWHHAVDILTSIACTSDDKYDREIAMDAIEKIEEKYDQIGGELPRVADACIEQGYLDLYVKLIQ